MTCFRRQTLSSLASKLSEATQRARWPLRVSATWSATEPTEQRVP